MRSEEVRRAAEGIGDTLASIDAGTLDATPTERAYLAGAREALRAVVGDAERSSETMTP